MNEQEFNKSLLYAMAPSVENPGLGDRVETRIRKNQRKRGMVRRTSVIAFATVATILGFLNFYVTPVEATLRRIAGALDGVDRVQMIMYSVGPDGKLTPFHTVSYDHTKWRVESSNGAEKTYFLAGQLLELDSMLGCFVRKSGRQGPFSNNAKSMRLSDLLSVGGNKGKTVAISEKHANGRKVLEATVEDSDFNTRFVLLADKQTELPFEGRTYSLELGQWRLKSEMVFNYSPSFRSGFFVPDPRLQVLSEEEHATRMVRSLTRESLGEIPLANGRLVIRALDVAADGTVFVAYQAGDRRARNWRGFGITVTDGVGTKYAPMQVFGDNEDMFISLSNDGKLELETFVPVQPVDPWNKRTVELYAARTSKNELVRFTKAYLKSAEGSLEPRVVPNVPWNTAAKSVLVLAMEFDSPSCSERPPYASIVNLTAFGNDIRAAIAKAGARITHYKEAQDWLNLERWLEESLRLKREHEAQGYGGWSMRDDLEALEIVRQKLASGPK